MFAILAAILFAVAVIFDLTATSVGNITSGTLVDAGLFCLAMHLAGYGTRSVQRGGTLTSMIIPNGCRGARRRLACVRACQA
jgi:hypothetical protein